MKTKILSFLMLALMPAFLFSQVLPTLPGRTPIPRLQITTTPQVDESTANVLVWSSNGDVARVPKSSLAGVANQDNVDVLYTTRALEGTPLTTIISNINSGFEFEIDEYKSLWVLVYYYGPIPPSGKTGLLYEEVYKILNKGKGEYGSGNESFELEDFLLVDRRNVVPLSIGLMPETQYVYINDLGSLTVSEFVNETNPPVTYQPQEEGYVIVQVGEGDEAIYYLFVGDGGNYGEGALQTEEDDFVLMSQNPYLGSESQLQLITEDGNTGWRLLGKNPNYYGNIGIGAVDLSASLLSSTTKGATGQYSFAANTMTTASAPGSTAFGFSTLASGDYSISHGSYSQATGFASFAGGSSSFANGHSSFAFGPGNTASTIGETVLGIYALSKTGSATSFDENDYAFRVGIGSVSSSRKDGFQVRKNGEIIAPNLTTDKIIDSKSLITKEYFEANSGGGGSGDPQTYQDVLDENPVSTIPAEHESEISFVTFKSKLTGQALHFTTPDDPDTEIMLRGTWNGSGELSVYDFEDGHGGSVLSKQWADALYEPLGGGGGSSDYFYELTSASTHNISANTLEELFPSSSNNFSAGSYEIICHFNLSNLSGAGGTIGVGLTGTATITRIMIEGNGVRQAHATANTAQFSSITTSSFTPISASSTFTEGKGVMRGKFTLTSSGSVKPNFGMSVNMTGVSVDVGSYYIIRKLN